MILADRTWWRRSAPILVCLSAMTLGLAFAVVSLLPYWRVADELSGEMPEPDGFELVDVNRRWISLLLSADPMLVRNYYDVGPDASDDDYRAALTEAGFVRDVEVDNRSFRMRDRTDGFDGDVVRIAPWDNGQIEVRVGVLDTDGFIFAWGGVVAAGVAGAALLVVLLVRPTRPDGTPEPIDLAAAESRPDVVPEYFGASDWTP